MKKILQILMSNYRFISQTLAFRKRYKKINKDLFKKNLGSEHIQKYIEKWSVFGFKVEVDTFILCYNLSGIIDYNIVPENLFAAVIEPKLNKYKNKQLSFIAIKNIYSKWFEGEDIFPKIYLNKIDGIYYDGYLKAIDDLDNYLNNVEINFPIICKPSLGTAGGQGVKTLKNLEDMKNNLDFYDNLVFQEKIVQHDSLQKIHTGINSIRTCLYRTKSGKFKVINNSIRFGVNGGIDNLTAGGMACNIHDNGKLNSYAVKKYCEKFFNHPNSNVRFSEVVIPNYSNLFEVTEYIANQIPLCNLVSLDMCLDINGRWRCLEINLTSQTIRFAQYAGKGFFADYTDDIIKDLVSSK